jgi:hypothetical protein
MGIDDLDTENPIQNKPAARRDSTLPERQGVRGEYHQHHPRLTRTVGARMWLRVEDG